MDRRVFGVGIHGLCAELTVIRGGASSHKTTSNLLSWGGNAYSRGWLPLLTMALDTGHHSRWAPLCSVSLRGRPLAHFSRSSSLNCFFHQSRNSWTRIRLPTCYFRSVLLTESLVKGFGWSCRRLLGFCEASLQLSRISLKTCSFV